LAYQQHGYVPFFLIWWNISINDIWISSFGMINTLLFQSSSSTNVPFFEPAESLEFEVGLMGHYEQLVGLRQLIRVRSTPATKKSMLSSSKAL
jgi:hypothetical protein